MNHPVTAEQLQQFEYQHDESWYVPTAIHEEVKSRLLYVAEQRRRLGLVTGASGVGKSMLLRLISDDLRRQQQRVIQLDAGTLTDRELLWNLTAQLQLAPSDNGQEFQLWRELEDELVGSDLTRRPITLLIDNVFDECPSRYALHRLFSIQEQLRGWLTILMTSRESSPAICRQSLAGVCELVARLEPLDLESTRQFVGIVLRRLGHNPALFDDRAIRRLQAHTGGVPRLINRVCEMALLVAADQELSNIDADTLDVASHELAFAEAI